MGGHREVGQLVEAAPGVAEDLAVAAVGLQIDHDQTEGGHDLFAPDEQVQLVGDLVVVAAVGVA
ncbi:hypothetical protein D3C75_996530 [compost metagenome]